MNLSTFEQKHFVYRADLDRMRGQPSLEAMWNGDAAPATWRLWLVARLPTLAERCRWVSAELARQFAIIALDVAGVTGPSVEALSACAHIVDEDTAYSVEKAAYDVDEASYRSEFQEHVTAAVYAAGYAADAVASTYSADESGRLADATVAAISAADAANAAACVEDGQHNEHVDLHLGALVRDVIPWEWVREACSVDAPELLEDAST